MDVLRYGRADTEAVEVLTPVRVTSTVGLFLVHGGSWYGGSREMYHPHLEVFAAAGHVCASVGYRLDPQSRLADKLAGITAGYRRFLDRLRETQPAVQTVVVIGGSAGAHLGSMLALDPPPAGRPAACVCWYGPGTLREWPDMDGRIRAAMEQLCGARYDDPGSDAVFAAASPAVRTPGIPPDFLFLLAEHEDLFPHRDVQKLAERLRIAGAAAEVDVVPDTRHGFMMQVDSPPARYGFDRMREFLGRYETH